MREKLKNKFKNINIKREITEWIKYNWFFLLYLIVNSINASLLRAFNGGVITLFHPIPIVGDLVFIILIGSFCYLMKRRARFIYLTIWTIFFTFINVLNSIYYGFYGSYSSVSLFSTTKYVGEVKDALFTSVIKKEDFIYLILPLLMFYLYYVLGKKYKKTEDKTLNKKYFLVTIKIWGVFLILLFTLLRPVDYSRLAKQWNREYIVNRFGIYIYHFNDLISSLQPKVISLFGYDQAKKSFNEYFKDVSDKQPYKNKYTNIYKGKNVLFIHGESIQNFVINLKINGKEVTPNLNRLASNSLYFNNYYATVSTGTSSDSEFMLNTSLLPAQIGIAFVSYSDRYYETVPKMLKKKDYRILAFHANNGSYWNRNKMYSSLGYDEFYDKKYYKLDEEIGLGLADHSFFRQVVPYLKKENDKYHNFMATVVMLTNHTPFYDVSKYTTFDVDLKKEEIDPLTKEKVINSYPYMNNTDLGKYLKSVHYSDYALGEFLKELEDNHLLDNTVVVFYGDHDARLPRRDYNLFYNYDYKNDKVKDKDEEDYNEFDKYQYELNRKVPLMIWSKTGIKGICSEVMSTIDIMPTLGNMMGFYNKYALGNDVFQMENKNIAIRPNGSWISDYIYYDSQSSEQYVIKEGVLEKDYITNINDYVSKKMQISNDILVYNLLKVNDNKLTDETKIKDVYEKK